MLRAAYASPDYDAVAWRRFMSFVRWPDVYTDCWEWTGGTTGHKPVGYGCFGYRGRSVLAHRWLYERLVGPIPDGLTLDHVVCENPICVHPEHVAPRTRGENTLRSRTGRSAINARKTHCDHGHEFTPENTYTPPGRNKRMCRECLRAAWTRRNAKRGERRRIAREAGQLARRE